MCCNYKKVGRRVVGITKLPQAVNWDKIQITAQDVSRIKQDTVLVSENYAIMAVKCQDSYRIISGPCAGKLIVNTTLLEQFNTTSSGQVVPEDAFIIDLFEKRG